jgi:hypothetical protein
MKITPEHFELLRQAMLLHAQGYRERATRVSAERARWDTAFRALYPVQWHALYLYLNDENIDTALRAIIRQHSQFSMETVSNEQT